MTRRWLRWLAGAGLAALIVWGCERGSGTWWSGQTDLEIVFIVIDRSSDKPIPDAHIEVESLGGFYQGAREEKFVMTTDTNGEARKDLQNNACTGTDSLLGFNRSYIVLLPAWRYRAVAVGFDASEWSDLHDREIQRQVQRVKPGNARLIVRMPLEKKPDKKMSNGKF
jgi:hypothetical protein